MAIDSYDSLVNKIKEIEKQVKTAGSYYSSRNLSQSIIISERAFDIVDEVENCPQQIKARLEHLYPNFKLSLFLDGNKKVLNWYLAISYVQLGQFQNAIKVLSLSLNDNGINRDNYSYYHSLTQFIEVAQKIPLANEVITKSHSDVTGFLNQNSKIHWRHELMLMKSRYELLKGNFESGYYLAKEALALALMSKDIEDRYSGQVWDFHYDGLISLCLTLNQIQEAKSYISQWVNSEDQMPSNRLIRMNKCLSDIARFDGNLNDAERYAQIAIKYSDDTDYEETQFSSLCSLINSLIDLNKLDEGKKCFNRILKLESSERLFIKYHMCLIKFKWSKYADNSEHEVKETERQLLEYGNKLNNLLSVNYYLKDLMNENKTIVY